MWSFIIVRKFKLQQKASRISSMKEITIWIADVVVRDKGIQCKDFGSGNSWRIQDCCELLWNSVLKRWFVRD